MFTNWLLEIKGKEKILDLTDTPSGAILPMNKTWNKYGFVEVFGERLKGKNLETNGEVVVQKGHAVKNLVKIREMQKKSFSLSIS